MCVVAAVWQSSVAIQRFAFPPELVYLPFEALPSSNSGLFNRANSSEVVSFEALSACDELKIGWLSLKKEAASNAKSSGWSVLQRGQVNQLQSFEKLKLYYATELYNDKNGS